MRKNVFLSIVMLTFIVSTLNAQIVYTDITDGIPAGIDFNSDGTMEFDIDIGTNPGDYIDYSGYGSDNNIHALGTTIGLWDVPDCVASGFTIGASNQWAGYGDCSVDNWGQGNSTITFNQDEYLAVRFNLGGTDIYYGWIRFSMNNAGIMTYKDYAYNSTPNASINAGDVGSPSGINDFVISSNFTIYPNPAKNIITINNESEVSITEIRIIDLLGKEVKKKRVSNSSKQTIDVSELTKEIYLINIFDDENQVSCKKIIIE